MDAEEPRSEAKADDPYPNRFKKGNRVNPEGRRGKLGREESPSRLLRDMRAVYVGRGISSESEARKRLRRFFEEDPKGFTAQMARLEEGERGQKASAARGEEAAKDEGAARALEALERFLASEGVADAVPG